VAATASKNAAMVSRCRPRMRSPFQIECRR
jgi:hypothetical protein